MRKRNFKVVYEDNHLIIVNKETGILVQGDDTGDITLIDQVKAYVKEKYQKPGAVFLGLVHRLDRPVSGLVILARTSKGLERMNKIFKDRKIQKTYWAIVKNQPKIKNDRLVHWIKKDAQKNKVSVFDHEVDGAQKATLTYRYKGKVNTYHLLEVEPHTGRPHQIRAQLAAIGCPIKGDLKYGFQKANPDKSINLHARKLYFVHPIKNEGIVCVAGLPEDPFWEEFLNIDESTKKIKDEKLGLYYFDQA